MAAQVYARKVLNLVGQKKNTYELMLKNMIIDILIFK